MQRKSWIRWSPALFGILAVGCASQPETSKTGSIEMEVGNPASEYPFEAMGRRSSNGPPPVSEDRPPTAQDFLPFTDIGQRPYAQQLNATGVDMTGMYTRIRILNARSSADLERGGEAGSNAGFRVADDPRNDRNYKAESRGWLERRFGSRKITRAFIAEFDLNEPDITSSTALFSASFESDSAKGESWSTDESLSSFATPYFRVGPNTVLNATFKLKMAEEGDADVGANVVSALNTAATLIAPTSALVTSLTAPQTTAASTFLDNSVSNLFGRSIEETTTSALSLKFWSANPVFMVKLNLSDSNDIKDAENKLTAGEWAVYVDAPIASIFTGSASVGPDDFARLDPGAVLAFRLGEDLTVHDYIFARLDVAGRITSLNDAADMGSMSMAREEARRLCNRVSRGLAEMGLNNLDAAIAWWAMAETEQFSTLALPVLREPELCISTELLQQMGAFGSNPP